MAEEGSTKVEARPIDRVQGLIYPLVELATETGATFSTSTRKLGPNEDPATDNTVFIAQHEIEGKGKIVAEYRRISVPNAQVGIHYDGNRIEEMLKAAEPDKIDLFVDGSPIAVAVYNARGQGERNPTMRVGSKTYPLGSVTADVAEAVRTDLQDVLRFVR